MCHSDGWNGGSMMCTLMYYTQRRKSVHGDLCIIDDLMFTPRYPSHRFLFGIPFIDLLLYNLRVTLLYHYLSNIMDSCDNFPPIDEHEASLPLNTNISMLPKYTIVRCKLKSI